MSAANAGVGLLAGLKEHLTTALLTASLLGGGTAVVGLKINDARQDQQLEAAIKALPEIQKDVKETREVVIRLEAKQEK